MNAIEKIVAQINQQAETERDTLKATEIKRIDDEFQETFAQLTDTKEKQLKKQYDLLDSKYKQLRNRQQVEIRQNTLNEKQKFLTALFQAAIEEMENWDEEQVQAFAKEALEAVPISGKVQLLVGEKTAQALSQTWVEKMNQQLPFTMELATEQVTNQAGFILDDQGVQYNFIFKNLVQDIQSTMGFEIASQLFE